MWGFEGGAELLVDEIFRHRLGLDLQANWNWAAKLDNIGTDENFYLGEATITGTFSAGYRDAASFFRDVAIRLVRSGMSEDDALRTVLRGSLEGWFGFQLFGGNRTGFAARMRQTFPNWDPVDALLKWTLSQPADDLNPGTELHNRAFLLAGTASQYGFKASGSVTVGTGNQVTATRRNYSSGYVMLSDVAKGGSLVLQGSVAPMTWMIARIR